jgi:cytochrome c5
MITITHRWKAVSLALFCALAVGSFVLAEEPAAKASAARSAKKDESNAPVVHLTDDSMRIQGEQRFRANCSRCHAAPQKFPPRMMKTVLRHMRVRATITDEDMRLVLFYMSQ